MYLVNKTKTPLACLGISFWESLCSEFLLNEHISLEKETFQLFIEGTKYIHKTLFIT